MNRRSWKLTQEIVSVATGVGTIFLGTAALWVTLKVGRLEDYFRSEIAYRNEQLISSGEQLRGLNRQRLALQLDIDKRNAELRDIQGRVLAAQLSLKKIVDEDRGLKVNLDERLRAQTYELLSDAGHFNMINYAVTDTNATGNANPATTIQIGAQFEAALKKAGQDSNNAFLKPYIEIADSGLRRQCPALGETKIELPAADPSPAFPNVKPKSANTEDIVAAQREANRLYDVLYKKHDAAIKARQDALMNGFEDFYKVERKCLCNALASQARQKSICRESKLL